MFVCICNALTDKQIWTVLRGGARCAVDVHPALGCAVQCGQCLTTIETMVKQFEAEDRLPLAAE